MNISKKNILNQFYYVFINYLAQGMNVMLNLILIRYLTSSELGTVTLGKIFFQVADYLHLGTRYALDRYLPIKNNIRSIFYLNSVILLYFVISILYLSVVLIFWIDNLIYIFFAFSGVLFNLTNFVKIFYRSKQNYNLLNLTTMIIILLPIIIQLIGILLYQYIGFIYGFIIGYIASFYITYKFNNNLLKPIGFKSSFNIFNKKLRKPGTLLFIDGVIVFLAFTIDKLFVKSYLGLEMLGSYTVVLFFITLNLILPSTISELLFPKIIKNAYEKEIHKIILKYIIITFCLTIIFCLFCFYLYPIFIPLVIPNYSYLINEILLSLLVMVPYAIIPFLYHYLNGLNKQKVILRINIISFTVYLISIFLFFEYTNIDLSLENLILLKILYFFIQSLLFIVVTFYYMKLGDK